MSNSPPSIKVETTSLKSSIAFGISALGAIPLRYNQPRFPALRRRWQEDTQENRFLAMGGGRHPDMLALATITSVGKPQTIPGGNQAVLRKGVNLTGSNGQRYAISGAYVEVAVMANVYAEKLDDLLFWMTSVIELPTLKGRCELADDGQGFDLTAKIEPRLDWTDPVDANESGGNFLMRMYSTSVTLSISTLAARINSTPLFRSIIERTQVEGEAARDEFVIPATEVDDWP